MTCGADLPGCTLLLWYACRWILQFPSLCCYKTSWNCFHMGYGAWGDLALSSRASVTNIWLQNKLFLIPFEGKAVVFATTTSGESGEDMRGNCKTLRKSSVSIWVETWRRWGVCAAGRQEGGPPEEVTFRGASCALELLLPWDFLRVKSGKLPCFLPAFWCLLVNLKWHKQMNRR